MTQRAKAWLSGLLRYGVCAAALTWLWFNTDWLRLRQVLAEADWRLVLAGLVLFGPAPVGAAARLKVLLAVQRIPIRLWQAIRVTFAGNFIIHALPLGTPGGDSVKAYYVACDTPHKHQAVTVVFFDRVVGVLGLVLMSGVMLVSHRGDPAFRLYGRVLVLAFVLFFVGLAVCFSRRLRRVLHIERILSVLPLASHLQQIDRAVFSFRHHPGPLAISLGLTFLLQFAVIVSLFVTGCALNLVGDRPWQAFPVYLAYTPVALLMGALPIGVMEVTFQELLSGAARLGTPEAAISLSLLCRFIQLVWALPGILVVLKKRPRLEPDLIGEAPPARAEP